MRKRNSAGSSKSRPAKKQNKKKTSISVPRGRALREALTILGPQPVRLAAILWRRGWQRLQAIEPRSHRWNVGVRIAAILSLAEGRPGIVEFWEDYRDDVYGWPTVLSVALETLSRSKADRDPILVAEIALSVAFGYCMHDRADLVTMSRLVDRRAVYEEYRVQAMQATFIGPTRYRKTAEPTASDASDYYQHICVRTRDKTTSVAFRSDFYKRACKAIGEEQVKQIARESAKEYRRESGIRLSDFVRHAVVEAVGYDELEEALKDRRVLENKSRVRSRRGSSKGPTRIVTVGIIGGSMRTISISLELYRRAIRLLKSKRKVNDLLRAGARRYREDSGLSRSEAAREWMMVALCQHPEVEQIRVP